MAVNLELARRLNLSPDAIAAIYNRHNLRDAIEATMGHSVNTYLANRTMQNYEFVMKLINDWRNNEAQLQKLWGFEQNPAYYKEWNIPGCTCPKMDNEERYPSGMYVVSSNCPIHGEFRGL